MEDIRGVRLRKFKLRKIILGVRMHFRHNGSQTSVRYDGAAPWTTRYIKQHSLYEILASMGSQCSCCKRGRDELRAGALRTRRAARFTWGVGRFLGPYWFKRIGKLIVQRGIVKVSRKHSWIPIKRHTGESALMVALYLCKIWLVYWAPGGWRRHNFLKHVRKCG